MRRSVLLVWDCSTHLLDRMLPRLFEADVVVSAYVGPSMKHTDNMVSVSGFMRESIVTYLRFRMQLTHAGADGLEILLLKSWPF